MFKVFGVALVCLAIALAVVPMFTDCQSDGKAITLANGKQIPMKCHWTGVAEGVLAIPLGLVGGMMVFGRRKDTITYLSVAGIAFGAMALAVPTRLIGVCQTPTMGCVTTTKPALLSLGGVVIGMSAVGLVLSRRSKKLL